MPSPYCFKFTLSITITLFNQACSNRYFVGPSRQNVPITSVLTDFTHFAQDEDLLLLIFRQDLECSSFLSIRTRDWPTDTEDFYGKYIAVFGRSLASDKKKCRCETTCLCLWLTSVKFQTKVNSLKITEAEDMENCRWGINWRKM